MFRMTVETTSDAFVDMDGEFYPTALVAILRQVARDIDAGAWNGKVRDANGNRCGSWELSE